jgi:hypothetical protein
VRNPCENVSFETEIYAALWKRVVLYEICSRHSGAAEYRSVLEYYTVWRDKYSESCLKWNLDLMETYL